MADPDRACPACRHPFSHHPADEQGIRRCTRAAGEAPVGCADCQHDWELLRSVPTVGPAL